MKTSLKFAFILGFLGFATSFGAHIVAVNLPFYAEKVGIGLTMIGLLIAVYDFAEIIAKPVFGGLADKRGMKKALSRYHHFYIGFIALPFCSSKTFNSSQVSSGVRGRFTFCCFPRNGRHIV